MKQRLRLCCFLATFSSLFGYLIHLLNILKIHLYVYPTGSPFIICLSGYLIHLLNIFKIHLYGYPTGSPFIICLSGYLIHLLNILKIHLYGYPVYHTVYPYWIPLMIHLTMGNNLSVTIPTVTSLETA